MLRNIYIVFVFFFIPYFAFAQQFDIRGTVKDSKGVGLSNVNIDILGNASVHVLTDEQGQFSINDLQAGVYQLRFSHVGFKSIIRKVSLDQDQEVQVIFSQQGINIDEVYVTGRESRNISTSTIITKDAMQHLQPSSFTDILELLPGGRSMDPQLSTVNGINLRTPQGHASSYTTGSLGTQFSIDGMLLNSQSMIDPTAGLGLGAGTENSGRIPSAIGVDMRTINTDNISSVEIIRGIPSVEYGNLTSGVVLVERTKGYEPWSLRIKADGFSKIVSLGKGIDIRGYKVNFDADYLDSKADVTNIYNSFRRLNGSFRGEKVWDLAPYRLTWGHQLNVRSTIDNERFDPDNDLSKTDRYKNAVRNISFGNTLKIHAKKPQAIFRSASLAINLNAGSNQINMDRFVSYGTGSVEQNSMVAGSHEVAFIQNNYVGNLQVDSRPIDFNVKVMGNWLLDFLVKHQVKSGIDYLYTKNIGDGQRYDPKYPISSIVSTRPRAFHTIPAMSNLSAFVEDRFFIPMNNFRFENSVGLRAFTLTNLDPKYAIAGKIYVEPRYNGRLHLPQMNVFGKKLKSNVFGGYGVQTLAPTQNYLYPNLNYRDISELIYFHNNPDYRLAWANTVITDPTNFNLKPARNRKWELGAQLDLEGNFLSINYFNEFMNSGFRSENMPNAESYRKYIVESVDPATLTAKPSITDFAYRDQAEYLTTTRMTNGSRTEKQGIEYQFSSKRISGINTRFTVNGAWFLTKHRNEMPVAEVMSANVITEDNKVRQYYALYANGNTGGRYESFNTNLTADSFLPKLGLNLSLTLQSMWFDADKTLYRDNLPIGYYDIEGIYHVYTAADQQDPILRNFDRKIDPYIYNNFREPIDLRVNLKATKVIKERIRVSMFVNKLFVYAPNYYQYGNLFLRENSAQHTPYFGMEVNIKI